MQVEEDAPIANAAAEALQFSLELPHVALERVFLHTFNSFEDAGSVASRNALKRFLRGTGEDDEPVDFPVGVHQE
jgi:hypothetical protein